LNLAIKVIQFIYHVAQKFMKLKKIFTVTKIIIITLILFLISDFILSNTLVKYIVNKDCFKYLRYSLNNKKYYSYELEKNCSAYEVKKTVNTYKVYTDKNGFRVSKKYIKKNKEKIVFLGDSFTYGFGLDYDDSVVGIINKKIDFETINLAVPGYGSSILLYKYKKLLNSNIKPKKVFYLMDITDVYDGSNRWTKLNDIDIPVVIDDTFSKEISKTLTYKKNFKISRLFAYNLNKFFRNIRKKIKRNYWIQKDEVGPTNLGGFTYTPKQQLSKNVWKVDYEEGLKKIHKNVRLISSLSKNIGSSFYIVIYPWAETLEYGEKYFSWQKFGVNLCKQVGCTKLINAFPDFEKVKNENIKWKKEIYFLLDIHFNKNGNKILANKIINEVFIK